MSPERAQYISCVDNAGNGNSNSNNLDVDFTVSTCVGENGDCSSESCCSGLSCVDNVCTSCKTSVPYDCSNCRACSQAACTGGCYWDSDNSMCLKDGYEWDGDSCEQKGGQCSPYCTITPWNADCYTVCNGASSACCYETHADVTTGWCNSTAVVVCTTSNPC